MAIRLIPQVASLLFLLHSVILAKALTLDVKHYGVKVDGKTDDSQAINKAWKDACAATNATTLRIGKGNYMVSKMAFQGPCKSPLTVDFQGTFKAPSNAKNYKNQEWVSFTNLNGLTLFGGGTFDGQGAVAWSINNCAKTGKCGSLPNNLRMTGLTNSIIRDITSLDSKLFHINIINCKNLTLERITITAPESSLNTDGIHIGRSTGVNITSATIKTGDDCVSIGDGAQQINIEKVTCGPGHGISIGSLGRYHDEQPVVGITVKNCTLTSTMNGVRIKTWPASPSGLASNMRFENIIMNNVSNPIMIDQQYCPYSQCEAKIPSRVKISDVSFSGIRGTSATQLAVKLVCSKGIPCQNVAVGDINLAYNKGQATSQCANVKPQVRGSVVPAPCTEQYTSP
uniref:Polygalacturonase n=1 Tax=Hypericum perforatum TaxID=65561 RepID=D9ZHD7_HYPPE|nr:polygalacturonase [Hypericum perforatum]